MDALHVHEQRRDLHLPHQPELPGLLDLVGGVGPRAGEAEHLRARRLRLEQEGREVRGLREGVGGVAEHLSAGGLHHLNRLGAQELADGVVRGH